MSAEDLSSMSMLELFRVEAESQAQVLTAGLLALERLRPRPTSSKRACAPPIRSRARRASSGLASGVGVAHAMEDCFVAAQEGRLTLRQGQIDLLLRGVDLLTRIARTAEADGDQWDCRDETGSRFLRGRGGAHWREHGGGPGDV